jgi:hypothetical protein
MKNGKLRKDCLDQNFSYKGKGPLAFLTPPFLGGISAQVCEISPHNSDFLLIFLDE